MSRPPSLPAAAACLILAACASAPPAPPKTCDGRHRRPANPYGSVLQAPPAPLADAQAGRPSIDALSFQPCGSPA
jgi:hypothetical protein